MIKKTAIRAIRKAAYLTHKSTFRVAYFAQRVEHKASRILSGTDSSFGAVTSVPFERLYYSALPYITPLHPSLPLRGRKPAVVLLLPTLDNHSFFGGTATAIFAAALLAEKKGLDLRIVQTLKYGQASVSDFLKSAGIPFTGKVTQIDVSGRTFNVYGYLDMHPDDICMASAWWDAYLLSRLPLPRKFVYLVQDYEPIFYANSDLYVLSESTYHGKNFVALCNTELMHTFMANRHYTQVANGAWFEPAVSYYRDKQPAVTPGQKKRIFVYGRTNVERNLFFAAFSSLEHCFANKYLDANDWEVFMAGQDKIPDVELSSGVVVKNLGKMDLPAYRDFISTVDVAISLMMAPHPNYPTLEFASAGAAVVTTRYDAKQDLSNYSKNIIMADITPESISGAIRHAAGIDRETRLRNAKASHIPNNWEETLSKPLDTVIKKLDREKIER